jgi:hypothetical protein
MGALKTISIDIRKITGIDPHPDWIALHCKDKDKVESFRISDGLKLTFHEDQQEVSVPFIGPFWSASSTPFLRALISIEMPQAINWIRFTKTALFNSRFDQRSIALIDQCADL